MKRGMKSGTKLKPAALTGSQRNARWRARNRKGVVIDELLVACWCEADFVFVSPAEVRALRTGSCGRRGCEAPGEECA